jgi:hypothetical protein
MPWPRRPSSTQRGYGYKHQQRRARWAPIVAKGKVRCSRCGEPIQVGQAWHLDHEDEDRTRYRGPGHEDCNVGAGRELGAQRRATGRTPDMPHPGYLT